MHIYYAFFVIIFILIIIATVTKQGSSSDAKMFNPDADEVKPYISRELGDGKTKEFFLNGSVLRKNGNTLVFHVRHHDVLITYKNTIIYELHAEQTMFGKTVGSRYIIVNIPNNATSIRVQTTANYKSVYADTPTFYSGSPNGIVDAIIHKYIGGIIIGAFNMMLGIAVLIYYLLFRKKSNSVAGLLYVATDTIIYGAYEIVNSRMVELFVSNFVILSAVTYTLLMMLSIPFILYTKNTVYKEDKFLYIIAILFSAADIIIVYACNFLHIADFKETLFLTHLTMLFTTIYAVFGSIVCLKTEGFTKQNILYAIGLSICVICGALDILLYNFYLGDYGETLLRIGFTSFIITLVLIGLTNTMEEIELGKQAKYYEDIANTDALTGLYSHTKFVNDAQKLSTDDPYTIISMDLNNLKRINDEKGHIEGDVFIRSAGNIIKNTFDKEGTCYRTGGDEFVVILNFIDNKKTEDLIEKLISLANDYNKNHHEKVSYYLILSAGYAAVDSENDKSFEDVLRRADSYMYENKKAIKAIQKKMGFSDNYVDNRL